MDYKELFECNQCIFSFFQSASHFYFDNLNVNPNASGMSPKKTEPSKPVTLQFVRDEDVDFCGKIHVKRK